MKIHTLRRGTAIRSLLERSLHAPEHRAAPPQNRRCRARAALSLVVLSGLLFVTPRGALAAERSAWGEAGIGVLSVLSSAIYGPVKVIYAGVGALTAGFAYALTGGQQDLAQVLIARSLRGDYLVTSEHLSGERPLVFVGRDPAIDPSPSDQPSDGYPY